jgi:hypothetical protein
MANLIMHAVNFQSSGRTVKELSAVVLLAILVLTVLVLVAVLAVAAAVA